MAARSAGVSCGRRACSRFSSLRPRSLAFLSFLWDRGTLLPQPSDWLVGLATIAKQWWALPFAAGVLLTVLTRREVTARACMPRCRTWRSRRVRGNARHVESSTFATQRMAALRARLTNERGASRSLTRLGAIVRLAEARYSPMGHVVLQLLGLWDLHVVVALERWQAASGAHARDWLAALGEAEAFAAFATFAHDNPGMDDAGFRRWAGTDRGACTRASAAGERHAREQRRRRRAARDTFLLVTGSNMSGKSTLLQSDRDERRACPGGRAGLRRVDASHARGRVDEHSDR